MVVKKKSKTLRAKKSSKPAKFASGKAVNASSHQQHMKNATPREPIVLDRVAKTFAKLEEGRGVLGTPLYDAGAFLEHTDDRGSIFNIMHEPIGALALITSKKNTVRANHYHKEDAHLCYVVSGSIEYYERPVGSNEPATKFIVKAGEGMYTGPNVEHAMYFPEDTTFLTLGRLSRTPDEYEKDLVRLSTPLATVKVGEMKEVVPLPTDLATTPAGGTPIVPEA